MKNAAPSNLHKAALGRPLLNRNLGEWMPLRVVPNSAAQKHPWAGSGQAPRIPRIQSRQADLNQFCDLSSHKQAHNARFGPTTGWLPTVHPV